jgi:Ca2+-binding EF-hand superfamily protein
MFESIGKVNIACTGSLQRRLPFPVDRATCDAAPLPELPYSMVAGERSGLEMAGGAVGLRAGFFAWSEASLATRLATPAGAAGRCVAKALPLLLTLLVPLLSGCSTGKGSPLDQASLIDREFVIAAVTWDLNKDGNVTCDEWKQYVTSLFREADANHDGMLTREEYAVLSRRDRLFETAGFNYFDTNGDGRISLSEMLDKPNPAFVLLDRNHDCVLTPDERVQASGPREDAPRDSGKLPPMGGPGR